MEIYFPSYKYKFKDNLPTGEKRYINLHKTND